MANNYDSIAGVYDRIHHLFYGQSEVNAQVELLDHVREGDRLLIVGGGTGWILEKLAARYAAGLEITYVESSARMMERSKRRDGGENKVEFFRGRVEDWPGKTDYDCILTGFFFDNFRQDHAQRIVGHLTPCLKTNGFWLETDFYYPRGRSKLWQAILLRTMYVSARLICGVEAKHLPDMEDIFITEGYRLQGTTFHYQRFIRSLVLQKDGTDPAAPGSARVTNF